MLGNTSICEAGFILDIVSVSSFLKLNGQKAVVAVG